MCSLVLDLHSHFVYLIRLVTSARYPYHVQRCIAFHPFQILYGIILFLNWHGPNRPRADTVKGKVRNVNSRIIALIWKLSASPRKVLYYFYPVSTSIITQVLFHANIYRFYQSLVYKFSATVISCNQSWNWFFFSTKGTLF